MSHRAPLPPPSHPTPPRSVPSKSGRPRSLGRALLGGGGALLMLISFPCVGASLSDLFAGGENLSGAILVGGFFVVVGLFGTLMLHLAVKMPKEAPFRLDRARERQILELARSQGGLLSVASLALHVDLDIDQSAMALEQMERQGIPQTWIDDHGDLAYRFAGLSGGPTHTPRQAPSHATRDLDAFDRELGQAPHDATSFDFEAEAEVEVEVPHPSSKARGD